MFFGKTITKNVAKCIRDVNAQSSGVYMIIINETCARPEVF
jgi:hypothetical protein